MAKVFEIREYQQRVIRNFIKAYEEGHKSILIELPTGSGKTLVAHAIAKHFNEVHGLRYGWTCMRQVLLKQSQEANKEFFNLNCGTYFSTFLEMDRLPTGIDLLIEDEAQHSAAATSTAIVARIRPKIHVALTATPYRTDRMKLCFSKVIRDAGTRQLIDEGFLSPFHQYLFNGKWDPETVAAVYLNDTKRWGQSVMFFLTIEECNRCQTILAEAGVRSAVVVGGDVRKQEECIVAFMEGKLDVLLNVAVLTEGFDAPQLKTVFVRPGSKGPTVQMCGRVLRRHPEKPFAQIVQSTTSPCPFSLLARPSDRFALEGGMWVSRKESTDSLLRIQQNTAKVLVSTTAPTLSKFILINRNKFKRGRVLDGSGAEVDNDVRKKKKKNNQSEQQTPTTVETDSSTSVTTKESKNDTVE